MEFALGLSFLSYECCLLVFIDSKEVNLKTELVFANIFSTKMTLIYIISQIIFLNLENEVMFNVNCLDPFNLFDLYK